MLTPATLRTSIDNLLDTIMNAGFAVLRQPVICLGSGRQIQVRWPSTSKPVEMSSRYGSVNEYITQLDNMAYSAILMDGSIVQLDYGVSAGEIVRHRLAFYPCPFEIEANLLEEFSLRDVIEASMTLDLVHLRAPVRFDYAPETERDDHPASHVHFNHEECRLAVSSPVSPVGFIRFIAKNFYPAEWASKTILRELRVPQWNRSIRPSDEAEWHLNQHSRGIPSSVD